MKILDIDWQAFLQVLENYRRLPFGARRFFVKKVQPSQAVPNATLGEWLQPFLESGLMVPGPQGRNLRVDPRFAAFSRVVRSFDRSRIFESATREAFQVFLSEHLDGPEIAAFSGAGAQYYYYRDYQAVQRVYGLVCSGDWIARFLAADDPDWESQYQSPGSSPYFSKPSFRAAQGLVEKLVPGAAPVPLAQLPGMCPEVRLEVLAAAIRAGFRYLLFYPCLLGEGLEPSLGLWPAAARRLSAQTAKAPEPVEVTRAFQSPFLMEDMTAVLAACAIEPPRLRVGDGRIFEADQRNLAAALGTLPEWVEKEFHVPVESRLQLAVDHLVRREYLADTRDQHMAITSGGGEWLALTAKDRLKNVLDALRGTVPEHWGVENRYRDKVESSLGVFAELPQDAFVRRREFLAYYREKHNPFVSVLREEWHNVLYFNGHVYHAPSREEMEALWEGALADFLARRLVPFGGVKAGVAADGQICFAVTGIGCYLLGKSDDFQLGEEAVGRIVVQPNFDVVFLAPSGKAESEIGRFSERRGRHVGALFKITKASVLAAAATGLTADRVLGTLREYCGADLPPNVAREIAGWFGQYRPVHLIPALLLHCPDPETARHIISAAGKRATLLTETTVEWHGERPQANFLKKLRELGIFVR